MTSEDRNFRYGYYEKVGFGGIDDKKQLELLLREKPPDLLSRLSQLAFRYTLSVAQRKQVWQLLLDVISPENQITEARIEIQREIVHDIFAGLSLMQLVDESILSVKQIDYSCTGQPRVLVLAFLVESKQLNLDSKHQVSSDKLCKLVSNSKTLQLQTVEVIDLMSLGEVFAREFLQKNSPHSLQDTYWIFRHFICCVRSNLGALIETVSSGLLFAILERAAFCCSTKNLYKIWPMRTKFCMFIWWRMEFSNSVQSMANPQTITTMYTRPPPSIHSLHIKSTLATKTFTSSTKLPLTGR